LAIMLFSSHVIYNLHKKGAPIKGALSVRGVSLSLPIYEAVATLSTILLKASVTLSRLRV